MTNLTEKWKKGELENGTYYVRLNHDSSTIDVYDCGVWWSDTWQEITEVLKEVPSYEEWQTVHEQLEVLLEENTNKFREPLREFAEANQSLRKQLDEEKAKNRIDYYNGSPMDFLDECERAMRKNKIYKDWINNISEELIISDLRRTEEGNKFIVNFLNKIDQVLGEE